MTSRLLSCLRRHQIVRLELHANLGHAPFGLPVALSAELVTLVFFRDFRPDGFTAVPISRISRIHTAAYERAYTRICATDNLFARCSPPRLDTTSLIPLLADLQRSLRPVLVNSAPTRTTNQTLLGRITAISDENLILRPFDATATWQARSNIIPLKTLLDVQWNSHYLKTYHRHLPPI